jgi:SAM-dependent methyltransferase
VRAREPLLDTDEPASTELTRHLPLPALHPVDYARGHAQFEARSDQRRRIVGWLDARLAEHPAEAPLSVLSVGCGTGAVDAPLAVAAAGRAVPGTVVRWTGIDPHGPSAAAFDATVRHAAPEVEVVAQACRFEGLDTADRFDVVTFVHSLYYVPDVLVALRRAVAMLAPGGRLLVLHAPLGALNQLAATLAPETDGHPQWWSDTVTAELAAMDVRVHVDELDAEVDLTGCDSADRALLDFTVQAELTDEARPAVLEALRAAARPGGGLRLPHPVTAFTVRPR